MASNCARRTNPFEAKVLVRSIWIFQAQDPTAFGVEFARDARKVLQIRYRLLPFLYTLFYKANTDGSTVVRPLMHEWVVASSSMPELSPNQTANSTGKVIRVSMHSFTRTACLHNAGPLRPKPVLSMIWWTVCFIECVAAVWIITSH